MGRRSSDRPADEDRPPLLVKSLIDEVNRIGQARGLKGYRVAYKVNAAEEHVIALIYPPPSRVSH